MTDDRERPDGEEDAARDDQPPGQESDPREPEADGDEGELAAAGSARDVLEADPLASADDEIDPELLALGEAAPRPGLYRPLLMVLVLAIIVVMMVWFRSELAYFWSSPEPVDLGEAHEVSSETAPENRYVTLEGIPLAPRNVQPSERCGRVQGFPTYQRRFLCRGHQSAIPLMGRPEHDLLVQRYLVRRLAVGFSVPDERRDEALVLAERAVSAVGAVRRVRRSEPDEPGRLVAEIEGQTGRTDLGAVEQAIRFRLEASVPGIRSIRVERVDREAPGSFAGRLVRLEDLGSRFAAVAEYMNECTDYAVEPGALVLLDGSEAGDDLFSMEALCYGQQPRQHWPYLALYVLLGSIFVLNLILLVRFFRSVRKR